MRGGVVVAALIAAALAPAGCGSSKAVAPQPRLTKAEFVAKANAICRRFDRTTRHLQNRIRRATLRHDFDGVTLAAGELLRPYGQTIFRMSRLRPPLRQEAAFREVIRLENKSLAYLRAIYRLGGTYELAKIRVIGGRAERVDKRVNALGLSLGLTACYR